jgi:hypothetical protein
MLPPQVSIMVPVVVSQWQVAFCKQGRTLPLGRRTRFCDPLSPCCKTRFLLGLHACRKEGFSGEKTL